MQRALIHRIGADGVNVFYREGGAPNAPVVLSVLLPFAILRAR